FEAPDAPQEARELPILDALRRTWQRHYERTVDPSAAPGGGGTYRVRFKAPQELPPAAEGIESPYDTEARYRHKRDTQWTGYMVHAAEPGEPPLPHLLTQVHTTTATVHEAMCTADIHQALSTRMWHPGSTGLTPPILTPNCWCAVRRTTASHSAVQRPRIPPGK